MMEFFKKNKALAVGGAIALVLLVVAGVFLFLYIRQYLHDTGEAEGAESTLQALETQKPGPTDANVQIVASNAVVAEASLKTLLADLRRGEIEPRKDMHRVIFNSFLKKTIDEMNKAVTQQCMVVPAKFDYGFKAYYSEGRLPADQDVSRLSVQVQMVKSLVDLMLQARIAEIVAIERQVFDEAAAATAAVAAPVTEGRGRGGQPPPGAAPGTPGATAYPLEPPDAQGLYTREHFTITIKTRDEMLAGLMNLLAHPPAAHRPKLFAVVTRLDIAGAGLSKATGPEGESGGHSEHSATTPAATPASATEAAMGTASGEKPALPKSREERIAAGLDNITVQLDVDVYRFAADTKEEKAKP